MRTGLGNLLHGLLTMSDQNLDLLQTVSTGHICKAHATATTTTLPGQKAASARQLQAAENM